MNEKGAAVLPVIFTKACYRQGLQEIVSSCKKVGIIDLQKEKKTHYKGIQVWGNTDIYIS